MAKNRVSRKQLLKEPDEFLTLSTQALQFARENQKSLVYGGIGVVAVVLVFFLFQFLSARSEQKAFALFQEGFNLYVAQTLQPSGADNGIAREKFATLMEQYGSSSAARAALPVYADVLYRQGDYDGAIALYEKALDRFSAEPSFEQTLWIGLAYAYEGKKEYATAAQWFEKVAQTEDAPLRGDAYFNLGRMHEALQDTENALEAYKKVADDFAQSPHATMAKDKVIRLQG